MAGPRRPAILVPVLLSATLGPSVVDVVLQRSLEAAQGPLRRLELQVFALSTAALAIAIVARARRRSASRGADLIAVNLPALDLRDVELPFRRATR